MLCFRKQSDALFSNEPRPCLAPAPFPACSARSRTSVTCSAALKLSSNVIFDFACLILPKKAPAIAGAFFGRIRQAKSNITFEDSFNAALHVTDVRLRALHAGNGAGARQGRGSLENRASLCFRKHSKRTCRLILMLCCVCPVGG